MKIRQFALGTGGDFVSVLGCRARMGSGLCFCLVWFCLVLSGVGGAKHSQVTSVRWKEKRVSCARGEGHGDSELVVGRVVGRVLFCALCFVSGWEWFLFYWRLVGIELIIRSRGWGIVFEKGYTLRACYERGAL